MSYQNQQMPTPQPPPAPIIGAQQQQQQQQQQQYGAPTVNNMPNGPVPAYSVGLKQQYLPPQIHTNGLDNTRNVSPAMNQPLNAAHLPPTSTAMHRPNMYAPSNVPLANAKPPTMAAPNVSTQQQIPAAGPPQSRPPMAAPTSSQQSTTMNYYQTAPIAKTGPPVNVPPPASIPNSLSADKMASNLQNLHLNNGNGVQSPTQSIQHNQISASHSPQITTNRLTNGNSTQPQPSPTIPGITPSQPPKSITPNVIAATPLQNAYGMHQNPNSIPLAQAQQPQYNGVPGPMTIPNKFPPINQPPLQPQQPPQPPRPQPQQSQQLQQQPQLPPQLQMQPPPSQQTQQFNNMPTPNVASNSTIGKRPLYPVQTSQQQPPPPPPPTNMNTLNNTTNSAYNQYHTPNPVPQNYPQTIQSAPMYSNQAYTQQSQLQPQTQPQQQGYGNNVVGRGFDSMWGHNTVDLMQNRHILPTVPVESPKITLEHQFYESVNCSPDIFRCTLTKIPESNALLQKSRLPLGILIHPFRDLNNLPVIQCSTIVRCRSCRTYINPFVYFVDSKKWKCNLCFRINELPDEFQYDPVSKSYGDVTRRPEVKSSTIEFIAPSEYMLRPPQPAIYLFLLDVSMIAQQSGYLRCVCESLAEHLDSMPGDARTQIGFVAYNSAVHFYSLAEGFNQPHEITVVDIDDPFLPCPDNLLINLNECKELIKDLLTQLPTRFANSHDSNSALGAALQVAFKLMQQTGGRVTVFQTCLPNVGPGALQSRENPNERSAKEIQHLGPATDFYKRHALECSGQQIAVDLFLMNSQYSDLATISGISKFSGGCIHHFPLFNAAKPQQVDAFKRCFERYLTRKIGFESVMRIRCTRGLTIHTFHGNFFVRSTDLLSLPNVNPDAGYGMQISYEENLGESKTVCFQAALLYTSSKGERRIRVHTLCLPITNCLTDVIYSADAQAIIGLISKMAVDRSLQSSIADARDAFINASCDIFSAYHLAQNIKSMNSQLVAPMNLSLLPLYMLALLKHTAFRTGTSTRLDDRVFAMCELKTLPLDQLIRYIYPDLYHLDCLFSENNNETTTDDANGERPDPPLLQLSAEHLKSRSMFLLDCGTMLLLLVGSSVPATILKNVFGVQHVNEIPDLCFELPNTRTTDCDNLHSFLEAINVEKPYTPSIQIIRDNSPYRSMFIEKLVDDRSESSLSYYEFLQHLRTQVK